MNIRILGVATIGVIAALLGGAFGVSWRGQGTAPTTPVALETSMPDASDYLAARPGIAALPVEAPTDEEKADLLFMREEEKLARDVYTTLYEKWNMPIFSNTAQSEQTHIEAVRALLVKYAVSDPVTNDAIGAFVDPTFTKLYADLTKDGMLSVENALRVGAFVEDLDIADLKVRSARTDNQDIQFVYENLERGSRNHLRAFVGQLTAHGGTYTPDIV